MNALLALNERIVVGPFQCNCRLIVCPQTGDAALVDPGDEPKKILQKIEGLVLPGGLKPRVKMLLHTHAHLDHIGGTRGVSEGLQAEGQAAPAIALHREDEFLYQKLNTQGAMFGFKYDEPLPLTHRLEHEEELRVGSLKLSVIHTPGHSPGSVCLRLHEDTALGVAETVFSGDTLFQGSVGRTDLWGADQELMFKSIRSRLLSLEGETRVCPGHGPDTRIAIEKSTNPFLI